MVAGCSFRSSAFAEAGEPTSAKDTGPNKLYLRRMLGSGQLRNRGVPIVVSKRKKTKRGPPSGFIFRPYITLPNGRIIFARNYGLKAFKISVRAANENQADLFSRKSS